MTDYQNLIIEPLNNTHNKLSFVCGVESLDRYLKKQAKQDIKRKISRIFIVYTPESPSTIIGYYTLSALSINLEQLPDNIAHKLPEHPIPAALIGRLAVSQEAQGQDVGQMLLMDAIKRTIGLSKKIAIYAMVVDAIDEQAELFYQQYGFSPLSTDSLRLFLPLKSF